MCALIFLQILDKKNEYCFTDAGKEESMVCLSETRILQEFHIRFENYYEPSAKCKLCFTSAMPLW